MRWRITRCAPHSAATPCGPPEGRARVLHRLRRHAAAAARSAAGSAARASAWRPPPGPPGPPNPPGAACPGFALPPFPNPPASSRSAWPAGLRKSARLGSGPSRRFLSSGRRPRKRLVQVVRQAPHYFVLPSHFRRDSDLGRSDPLAETRAARPLGPGRRHCGRLRPRWPPFPPPFLPPGDVARIITCRSRGWIRCSRCGAARGRRRRMARTSHFHSAGGALGVLAGILCRRRRGNRRKRAHVHFQIDRSFRAGSQIDFFGRGRKTELGDFHAVSGPREARGIQIFRLRPST